MAESLPSIDEQLLLQVALDHPFEPSDVPLGSAPATTTTASSSPAAPAPPPEPTPSEVPSEDDAWQTEYSAQVSEWRAQSASIRSKAELTRSQWETIRAHENAGRQATEQASTSSDVLGTHITASTTAASRTVSDSVSVSVASLSSIEHVESPAQPEGEEGTMQLSKADTSPSQRWEHISSSPTSSYPSMSFPEASVPHSPSHHPTFLVPNSTSGPTETDPHCKTDQSLANAPPSTIPSIMDNRVAPRTRLSLVLSSLAINLLLPFINGVMLGFGEIFAKDILVGWFGWKRRGSAAAGLGLRR